jgi:hypothetical protein
VKSDWSAGPAGAPVSCIHTNGTYGAYASHNSSSVEVWRLEDLNEAPIRLDCRSQRGSITSICFGWGKLGRFTVTPDLPPHAQ